MGKSKKKRPPRPRPDAGPSTSGPGPVAGAIVGAIVGCLLTLAARPGGPAPARPGGDESPGSETGTSAPLRDAMDGTSSPIQEQGAAMLRQQIEAQMAAMKQDPGRIDAEDPDRQYVFPDRTGKRWLVLLGRARPDDRDRWTAAIVRAAKDPMSGQAPEGGLAVEGSFELPGAMGIEGAAFNETGSIAMVLTRSHSRARAPGDLYRLVPGERHARHVDEAVFKFALSPGGDSAVYQRALDPEETLGARELKIFHASRQESQVVRSFDYPREQLGSLGPWGPGGVFVELTVERYGDGFRPESVVKYTLDPFNPSNFNPVGGQSEAAEGG